MGNVFKYVILATTMMLVLTFLGFQTGFTDLLTKVGFSYNESSGQILYVDIVASPLYQKLFGTTAGILALVGLTVTTIVIGFTTKVKTENILLLPFITVILVSFVSTFVSIMQSMVGTAPGWISAVVVTIFLPLTIGFVVALAEWFKGSDN